MIQLNPALTTGGDTLAWGQYPTPLRRVDELGRGAHDVWLKDEGASGRLYGGNKVRKLERLLAVARRRGARRLLTIGAAGSHHVLATCLYGRQLGLETQAVLTPQPWSAHAEATLLAGLNAGLSAVPARSYAAAVRELHARRRRRDFVIGPGGCGSEGTWAYRLAVDELAEQLRARRLSQLDAIIVAAGSGSTAAGILAGVLATGAARQVVAVQVAPNPALRSLIVAQALYASWRRGRPIEPARALRALIVENAFVGDGYGHASPAGEHAAAVARSFGLETEATYTAKALAATLAWAGVTQHPCDRRKLQLHTRQSYLYWHTLSSVPLASLLQGSARELPPPLAQLLRKPNA